jgi:hypothetical protein
MAIIAFSLLVTNYVYVSYFYKSDATLIDAKLLFLQDSLEQNSDVLYYAESSNGTYLYSDTCKLSIAQMIDSLSPLKVNAVDHGAIHARTFLQLIKNLKSDSKVKTIVVTLNSRSFGSPWINSHLETNIAQANVMYEPILPIFKRIKLSFNGFDNKPVEMRAKINEQNWQNVQLNVSPNFPYKTVRQWDDAMANGTYKLPNGEWDMPKISLACHYIKTYAFPIDVNTNPRIKDFDEIVNVAKQKNLKLIFHLLAENVQYADSLVGKELVNIMYQNKQLLLDRYHKDGVTVVNSFELVNGLDYIDQNWTTEHYNQTGRLTLAKNVLKYLQ